MRLADPDVLRLVEARFALERMWRDSGVGVAAAVGGKWDDLIFHCGRTLRVTSGCCYPSGRSGWAGLLTKRGLVESGALDPLRVDPVTVLLEIKEKEKDGQSNEIDFCDRCLKQKEGEWQTKKAEWWVMLGDLVKL